MRQGQSFAGGVGELLFPCRGTLSSCRKPGTVRKDLLPPERGRAMNVYEIRDLDEARTFLQQGLWLRRDGFDGVEFAPGIVHALLDAPPDEVLRQVYESLQNDGLDKKYLKPLYQSLIEAARGTAEVLGPEDIIELQHGTALDEEGERLAFRQVVQASIALEAALPRHRVRPLARRLEVPTHILDEDTYPVGGFSSLPNRGRIESLLHSQLAYIEDNDRPDLFDIKYLRDE